MTLGGLFIQYMIIGSMPCRATHRFTRRVERQRHQVAEAMVDTPRTFISRCYRPDGTAIRCGQHLEITSFNLFFKFVRLLYYICWHLSFDYI